MRKVVRALSTMPRGFNADGRALGLGLDAALRAQRAHGADVQPIRPSTETVPAAEGPYSRAS
ncbi:hypothetical protein ACQPZA_01795 [Pseudonocardia xinjiangensis]|uniref:hypothetical protein n=1 Tax=Pseudonocardia xinjiangensis TaxID=75289 RepID=UPI003D8E7127